MSGKRTELIKLWQYRKDHVFIYSHDDLTIRNYLPDTTQIVITLIVYIIGSVIMGLIFGLLFHDVLGTIKGSLILFGILCLYVYIYNFFMYINYISYDGPYAALATAFISAIIYSLSHNVYVGIISFFVLSYISIRIMKSVYYDKQNKLSDFLKENGVDET